jgi:hypothetical protein
MQMRKGIEKRGSGIRPNNSLADERPERAVQPTGAVVTGWAIASAVNGSSIARS